MVRPAFDVSQFTIAERLELIDALWESLRSDLEHRPVSDEELALIEERRAEHGRNPEAAIPWDDVRARLLADREADEQAGESAREERVGRWARPSRFPVTRSEVTP